MSNQQDYFNMLPPCIAKLYVEHADIKEKIEEKLQKPMSKNKRKKLKKKLSNIDNSNE